MVKGISNLFVLSDGDLKNNYQAKLSFLAYKICEMLTLEKNL